MLYIFICSKILWKEVEVESPLKRTRRVNILDCESFRFMANSKYFYYLDLIRYEVVFRSYLYDNTVKKGMFGVLASQKIIYKKPLKMWSKFSITLVLDGWDDKWVYHRQLFEQNNEICAIGYTKAGFWKAKKAQDMKEIIANCGVKIATRNPSKEMLSLFENDYDILKNN